MANNTAIIEAWRSSVRAWRALLGMEIGVAVVYVALAFTSHWGWWLFAGYMLIAAYGTHGRLQDSETALRDAEAEARVAQWREIQEGSQ